MLGAGHRNWRGVPVLALVALVAACDQPVERTSGPVVTVFGTATDRDADGFIASMEAFERSSGIDVLDHVIIGDSHFSLKTNGYFY